MVVIIVIVIIIIDYLTSSLTIVDHSIALVSTLVVVDLIALVVVIEYVEI